MTTRSTDAQVKDLIITPMTAMYTAPRGMENPTGALTQYLAALRPYPPEALEGGWIALVAAHDRTTWPVPAEIIRHIRDWVHSNVKHETKPIEREDGKSEKRYPDNAVRAMATKDGQMALEHGYGRILYQHVERNGWLEGFDHTKAKATDALMREQIAEMEANGDGFGGAILTMGKRRLETESELKSRYLRRAAA